MNLATLPLDIIRKIMQVGLDSIDNMRMISPVWNALAVERLSERKNLPILECVRWFMFEDGKDVLYVRIPSCLSHYFGADNWKNTNWYFRQESSNMFKFFFRNPKRGRLDSALARLLRRCSQLKKIEIDMTADQSERQLDEVGRALNGDTVIEEVSIVKAEYFHPSIFNSIMHAVRGGWIKRVVLSPSADYYHTIDSEQFQAHNQFVLDVAKCLGRIHMASNDVAKERTDLDYRRTKLAAHFPMSVTLKEMPIARFVLKAQ